jgi:hypothetical protein
MTGKYRGHSIRAFYSRTLVRNGDCTLASVCTSIQKVWAESAPDHITSCPSLRHDMGTVAPIHSTKVDLARPR